MQNKRDIYQDESYDLQSSEALLASTLALMTGHAQSRCAAHRELMVAKIIANLGALSEVPLLSPDFQALLWTLRQGWRSELAWMDVGPKRIAGLQWCSSTERLQ